MFKRLGRFAVLAVCLFALVIVMVGCNTDPPITPPIDKPLIDKPPVEVTQQRFTGTLPVPANDPYTGGIAWNPQGTMLAAGFRTDSDEVWLYDTATGELLKTLKGDFGSGVINGGLAWGSALFIGTDNDDVQMWDPATGQHLRTITDEAYGFAISPDSRILAAEDDQDIRLIDIGTGQVLRTINEEDEMRDGWIHIWYFTSPAFSPDGSTIAAGAYLMLVQSGDVAVRNIYLYDVATGRKKLAIPDLGDVVYQLAWNSDGSRIAAYLGDSNSVAFLDAATGQRVAPPDDAPVGLDASRIKFVVCMAWSPTAPNILAVGGGPGGVVELIDITTWQILKTLTHGSDVGHLAFSPDGKTLASSNGSTGETIIRLWDVSDVSR